MWTKCCPPNNVNRIYIATAGLLKRLTMYIARINDWNMKKSFRNWRLNCCSIEKLMRVFETNCKFIQLAHMKLLLPQGISGGLSSCAPLRQVTAARFLRLGMPLSTRGTHHSTSTNNSKVAKLAGGIERKYDDRLHKLISKSKVLTKLNSNPKFSHYFDRISEAGTLSTFASFLLIHELTAILPLLLLWWVFYLSLIHI